MREEDVAPTKLAVLEVSVASRVRDHAQESGSFYNKACCGLLMIAWGLLVLRCLHDVQNNKHNERDEAIRTNLSHPEGNFSQWHRVALSLSAKDNSAAKMGAWITIGVVGTVSLVIMGILFWPAIKQQITRCRQAFLSAAHATDNVVDLDGVTVEVAA